MMIGQSVSKTITLGWNKSVTGPRGLEQRFDTVYTVAGMVQDGYRAGARVFLG
jgi:hypothetical protein